MTDTNSVAAHYNTNPSSEHTRLLTSPLEHAISFRTINRCISTLQSHSPHPSSPIRILDLGGGTGRYAIPLSQASHAVTLADISSAELSLATTYAADCDVQLAGIEEVGALRVRETSVWREAYYDMVLCMGPLYHLTQRAEREQVLRDCAAMTKAGGYVCVAFVNRWGHLRDLVARDPERLIREGDFYEGYVGLGGEGRGGVYDRVVERVGYHVSGAGEIRGFFEAAFRERGVEGERRLEIERIVGCEGFLGGGLSYGLSNLSKEGFERWVEISMVDAEKEDVLGASDHLLVVAKVL